VEDSGCDFSSEWAPRRGQGAEETQLGSCSAGRGEPPRWRDPVGSDIRGFLEPERQHCLGVNERKGHVEGEAILSVECIAGMELVGEPLE
jgi:hypothetical protein